MPINGTEKEELKAEKERERERESHLRGPSAIEA